MTQQEIEAVKAALLSSKRIRNDAGEVEERSVDELREAIRIIEELEARSKKRPSLSRVGRYNRRYDDE